MGWNTDAEFAFAASNERYIPLPLAIARSGSKW